MNVKECVVFDMKNTRPKFEPATIDSKQHRPWISTNSGIQFFFPRYVGEEIDPDTLDIYDIAHSLAQLTRFNGHLERPYSVAQHCCLVSDRSENYPLEGLLHDASEAYTGDFPTPIKHLIPQLFELEESIDKAVAKKWGLEYPIPPEIRVIDKQIQVDECKLFEPPKHDGIIPWDWKKSKTEFLNRYTTLIMDRK